MYESSFTMTPVASSAIETGKQQVEQLVKNGSEAAAKGYEGVAAFTKENVDKAMKMADTAFKGIDEAAGLGKENIDALVASSTTLAKGAEAMVKSWVAFGQKSLEGSLGAAKDAMACKNLKDLVEWQTQFARDQFDALFGEATKQSELGVKAAQEAFGPISERFNVAVEKVLKQTA
ncbi:MAG: phasin family protein [Reyranellaceae bacterium]